jgi:hypothetical protein
MGESGGGIGDAGVREGLGLFAWGRGDVHCRYRCEHRCKICVGLGLFVL